MPGCGTYELKIGMVATLSLTVEWAALVDSWQHGCRLTAVLMLLKPKFVVIPCKLEVVILMCFILLCKNNIGNGYVSLLIFCIYFQLGLSALCRFNSSWKNPKSPRFPITSSFQTPAGEISQIQPCLQS